MYDDSIFIEIDYIESYLYKFFALAMPLINITI